MFVSKWVTIRALASARGSVATRRVATGPRARRARGQGHRHSRARRARGWPKHASPRARRARGRAKLSARLGACQCYYICFSQLSSKSRNSWAVLKTLMSAKNHKNCSGPLYLRYKHRVKKLGQFMCYVKSYATLKFRKIEVFVSKMFRHPDPSLSLSRSETICHPSSTGNSLSSIIDRDLFYTAINR